MAVLDLAVLGLAVLGGSAEIMLEVSRAVQQFWQWLAIASAGQWLGFYLRIVAGLLAYGAIVHISNILGVGGKPWLSTPLLWRVLDGVLLVFDVTVAIGLWMKRPWAIVVCVAGIVVLQIIPYTLFRSAFVQTPADIQTLNGLVATELLLLAVLVVLLVAQK